MTHLMYVKSFLLVHLENNSKKVEIRGLNKFTQSIKVGDIINFNNTARKLVKAVHHYDDLSSAVNSWNPELICPGYTKEVIKSILEKIYFSKIIVFEFQ